MKKALKSLEATSLEHMYLIDNPVGTEPKLIHFEFDAKIEFAWSFDLPDGNTQHLHATFDGTQLLKAAAEAGLLTETYQAEKRVPRGVAALVRRINVA